MATHFDPYPGDDDDDEAEQAPCGTWLGETSNGSNNWAHVDCGLCLKSKARISAAHEAIEAAIVEQMGDMAAYMRVGIPTTELEAADAFGFKLRK
ncbi:hypothetical protein [Pseudomonas koreensis]|jgi:hypothetical protein|uniref:hypothetical protein n=1 Tax=Pseudomonas koreensis TaxID=198620 RepID=UPI000E38D83D|nr:hypothetical protein [Pseudomonas koreensis]MBP3998337.1 hypothetical protein [Pseudomonas koreensis]